MPLLFAECTKNLFADYEKAKKSLQTIHSLLPTPQISDEITYYHYLGIFHNQYYNYKESFKAFEKGKKLLDSFVHFDRKAEFYIDFIATYMNLDLLEEASLLIAEVETFIHEKPGSLLKPKLLCREGYLNILLSQWSDATRLLFQALQLFYESEALLSIQDYNCISLIHSGLGQIYEKTNDPEKSKESYLQAIHISQKHHLNTRLGWYHLSAGNAFAMLGDTEMAISYFKKALLDDTDQNRDVRASAFANWGNCLFNIDMPDFALDLYNKAENIYKTNPSRNYNNLALIHKWKALLFAQAKDYANASGHLQKALAFAKKTENYRELANICEETAKLYAHTEHFDIAYDYQVLKAEYEEKYANHTKEQSIRELTIKYASEKKKQEIETLKYQAKALQLKALRAQMNPHFLYNALNSIQNFIARNNKDQAASYLSSFSMLMRKSLEFSELETISLEKEIDFLEHYLYINKHLRFRDRLNYEVTVSPDLVDEYIEIPSMIVQPYVENAIEHGLRSLDAGLITVSFDLYDEDTIRCIVADNGIGRVNAAENKNKNPELQLHKSKGTQITLDRLRMIASKFQPDELVKIEDNNTSGDGQNIGTKVTVLIPLT